MPGWRRCGSERRRRCRGGMVVVVMRCRTVVGIGAVRDPGGSRNVAIPRSQGAVIPGS